MIDRGDHMRNIWVRANRTLAAGGLPKVTIRGLALRRHLDDRRWRPRVGGPPDAGSPPARDGHDVHPPDMGSAGACPARCRGAPRAPPRPLIRCDGGHRTRALGVRRSRSVIARYRRPPRRVTEAAWTRPLGSPAACCDMQGVGLLALAGADLGDNNRYRGEAELGRTACATAEAVVESTRRSASPTSAGLTIPGRLVWSAALRSFTRVAEWHPTQERRY